MGGTEKAPSKRNTRGRRPRENNAVINSTRRGEQREGGDTTCTDERGNGEIRGTEQQKRKKVIEPRTRKRRSRVVEAKSKKKASEKLQADV